MLLRENGKVLYFVFFFLIAIIFNYSNHEAIFQMGFFSSSVIFPL